MKYPTWQRKIRENVRQASSPAWGRRYATFLFDMVAELDERFGPSRVRTPSARRLRQIENETVVRRIAAEHPDWSSARIGEAAGVSTMTAHRLRR